jgi:hypothetical protein
MRLRPRLYRLLSAAFVAVYVVSIASFSPLAIGTPRNCYWGPRHIKYIL